MTPTSPIHTDIVLVGGGHSHVAVLKSFGMRALAGVRLTLIARDVLTPYSGMLPGLVAGHYSHGDAHVDLRRLCRFAGARLYHSSAEGIDLESRTVHCAGRPPVRFDWLSLDIGSTPAVSSIDGACAHALAVKPVDRFLDQWPVIEARCIERGGRMDIVTIGGGAGGVELTLSLHHRLDKVLATHGIDHRPRFRLVSEAVLPTHATSVREKLLRTLDERAILVHCPARVREVGRCSVTLENGERLASDLTIAVTQASAAGWLAGTGLALDENGFVRVDDKLRSVSHPQVFATGDIAAFAASPLPKSGVYAVRQGPVLAKNLRRAARGQRLAPYRPQARTLALISTGDPNAVASYGPLSVQGRWVWRVKDSIDRRWMSKYQDLPDMSGGNVAPPAPGAGGEQPASAFEMRCGGCGSKVASPVLRRVLAQLGTTTHPDVLVGLDRSDDAAVIKLPPGQLLVQSVDHFRTFVDDPYLFARITTNHCLSDLFAMGATPHTVQAMVSLPFAEEAKIEQDLFALLTGVTESLNEAGAVLIGGHTAEGPELTLGLSVNGLVTPANLLTKGAMTPGDCLVLTKPLGTGVIFAADMRARAGAAVVDSALTTMLQSNQRAAECLIAHRAHACTDVTGFGLAGHLVEMLRASALDATLDHDAIPLLPGSRELFDEGMRSSLHAGNAAFLDQVQADGLSASDLAALIDPQTAGGLLASVPAERAEQCTNALQALGYTATRIIGRTQAVAVEELALAGRIYLH